MNRNKGKNFYWLKDENGEIKTVAVDADSVEDDKIRDRIYNEKLQEKGLINAWTTAGSPFLKKSNRYKVIFWVLTFLVFPTALKLTEKIKDKKVRFIILFLPFFSLRLVLKKYYGVKNDEK